MRKDQYKGKNKRELYRVKYPVNDRPRLHLMGKSFEVTNISEQGVRFRCRECSQFKTGVAVRCTITFHDNESYALDGTILHIYKIAVVLNLARDIPLERIIKEQRYILTNYPEKLN